MKQFHAFNLDTINHCLWRGDERVSLTPKAFDLLRYLVDHRERLVTHEEILEALWADTFVNPEVVKKYILGIRKVLGDRHDNPEFIRTFPKRGYQFVAPVTDERRAAGRSSVAAPKPLVDRHALRARLNDSVERALRGERQVVFVTGDAGIGKTTFVNLFVQRAELLEDVQIALGQCIEGFGGQEAYYPIIEVIDQLIRVSDDGRFVQALAARAPTWLLQFPSLVKSGEREALQREMVGATRERMVRELCDALEAITADRALILVVEDLHWADLSTLDVISTFARRQGSARVLLIATLRPEIASPETALSRLRQDLAIRDLCSEINLEPFAAAEVSAYVSLQFDQAGFAADVARSIHRHSGGNPLFVAALVRNLVANGVVVRDDATWKLTVPVNRIEPGVPPSLQDLLDGQFNQLPHTQQDVLRKASAIGERFPAWMVAAGTGDLDEVEEALERLAERRLFIRTAGMGELADGTISGYYEFHHSLYRQAIYRRLSDVNRSKLHRAIGQRLETLSTPSTLALAPELALHFEKAHQYERAIQYLMDAAANAARRFAVRDSLDVLQHAKDLVPRVQLDRRTGLEIQILERVGDAQYALGAMVESVSAFEGASALATRAGLTAAQVEAQICFARPLGLLDPDRAIAVLQQAVQASAGLGDPVMHARVTLLASGTRLLYDTWRVEDARVCDAANGIVHRVNERNVPGYERVIYSHVQSLQGEPTAALEAAFAAESGVATFNETTGAIVHLLALSAQILALLQLGRFGEVLRIVRASKEMAERNRSDPWLFLYREAWLRTLAMDFAGAQRVCEELIRRSVYPTGQAQTVGRLAAGFEALDQGRHDDARRYFDQVRDPNDTPKFFLHWYWRLHAHVGLTRAWLQSGNLTSARQEAGRLVDAALATADPNLHALACETRAQVAIAESNWSDASQFIDRALVALKHPDTPTSTWQVHRTAWELHRRTGQLDLAAEHRARARGHIGALVESFQPGEPLRQAMLGAAAVRHICEEELEAER
jgi:DNA-binding winged helix-turn-helix (wHTH) protein/tetratricopeptide (TPR) repeat protein